MVIDREKYCFIVLYKMLVNFTDCNIYKYSDKKSNCDVVSTELVLKTETTFPKCITTIVINKIKTNFGKPIP